MNPAQTKRFRLGHAVDRQEHVELASCQAQLADVAEIRRICRRDVDKADGRLGELASLGRLVGVFGQPGDAVPFQASMQAGARQLGNAVAQAAQRQTLRVSASTSSSGSSVRRRNSTTIASSASVNTVLWGELGPIGASSVVVLLRHLATVVRLSP